MSDGIEVKPTKIERSKEAGGDSEVVDDVAEVPGKPPPVEEVPEEPEEESEPVTPGEERQFVSVRDSARASKPGKLEGRGRLEVFTIWKEKIVDLVFWRDVRVSAFVFSLSLLALLSLRCFSVIAVVAYLALSLLIVTITFRLYKIVLQTINGTQQPNPFQSLLDTEVSVSPEQVQRYSEALLDHVNAVITTTRDLLLVKNIASSLKFGLLMWMLTYVGAWFNGLTLLTIDLVFAFTLPPFYEKYQKQIDSYCEQGCNKMAEVYKLIRAKLPGSGKVKTQ